MCNLFPVLGLFCSFARFLCLPMIGKSCTAAHRLSGVNKSVSIGGKGVVLKKEVGDA